MDEFKLLEWIREGGGYALAGFMFMVYRKDVLAKITELKDEKSILIDLISEIKVALTELTLVIKSKQ